MPAMRYDNDVDVQGWEPALDGGADVNLELPSNFGYSTATSKATLPSANTGRQAPLTRARSATCPNIYDLTFMPRQGPGAGPSTLQQQPLNKPEYTTGNSQSVSGCVSGPSSARNAAAAGRSGSRPRSSTERKIARKLAENANYVPRPKNSFILFRTEFVAQRTNGGAHDLMTYGNGSKSDDDDEEANQSLSKQASAVWNKMTEEEKRPYVDRARLEKAAHEAKYPHYRYKPVRHNPARKNGPPPPMCRASQSPFQQPSLALQRTSSEPAAMQATDTWGAGVNPHIDQRHGGEYQYSMASNSAAALDATSHVPQKLSLPSSLSSSSLANALGSRSPTPSAQEPATDVYHSATGTNAGSGLNLPTVPRVPSLTFSTSPVPSRSTALPPIPRSPSAPVFDRHTIGQFPLPQQYRLAPPTLGTYHSPYSSGPASTSPLRASCPSSPNVHFGGLAATTTSPVPSASVSDVTMQSALPTPESTEPDYFHDFVRRDSEDMAAGPTPTSVLTNQRSFTTNPETYYEKHNNNNTHRNEIEMDEMDIDMRALLNLSPVPEVAETSSSENVQRPFEAIAALWVQDQQLLQQQQQQQPDEGVGAGTTETVPQGESQPQAVVQTESQSSSSRSSGPDPSYPSSSSETTSTSITSPGQSEAGLDIYTQAIMGSGSSEGGDFDPFTTYLQTPIPNSNSDTCLEDDLFRLDLDFMRPTSRYGCAVASTLNLSGFGYGSGLGGLEDAPLVDGGESGAGLGDVFGYDRYDRERGLYGFGGPAATAAPVGGSFGNGFGYGLEYGF